ncbi:MAG: FtsX-like permease family protein [Acidimicrobiales bacterium]
MSTLGLKLRRDVKRKKWQFVAVFITVLLGVGLFAGSSDAYLNLGTSLESSYDRLVMADMTVTGADPGFIDEVESISGVDFAMQRRQVEAPFEIADSSLLGRIVGVPADGQPEINMIDIDQGKYLDPANPAGIVLETSAAEDFDLKLGDKFTAAQTEVEVIGIATSLEYLWPARDRQSLFTPPKSFAVIFADEAILDGFQGPTVSDQVLVVYDEEVDTEAVDAAVIKAAEAAGAGDIQTLAEQPSNATISLEIGALQTMAVALPLLFLAAAGMAIYVVITRLVYSQRGVIGTLRASGFSRKTMGRHYRSFGIGIGLAGAAGGILFGTAMGRGMTAIYTQEFGIPDLVAKFHWQVILLALAFGAIAGALASIAPARAVAALAPAEAMRGEALPTGGKRSIFETAIPPLRNAPVRWRMSLRGVGRNKKRSGSMILGVILSMTLILAGWGVMDSMLLAIDRQFNEVAIEDATAGFLVPVGDGQLASIRAVSGVSLAEPVVGLQATIRNGAKTYSTRLEGYLPDTKVHGFSPPLPGEGALLGQSMKDLLNVSVGDEIVVEFPALEVQIATTVAGFVDEPLATLAYMETGALTAAIEQVEPAITAEVLKAPSVTSVKAVFDSGSDTARVTQRIKEVDEVAVVLDSNDMRDLIESYQLFFYIFIGLMLVFGGAMAFALMFNIISVNVAERSGEFASMRANGLTHRRVASLIAGETGLLTAIGIVPGLIVGYLAAVAFTNSFASDQFPITTQLRPLSYIGAVVALFVVAGLSLIPAIRAVKRIDVAEVVRERAM